MFNARELQLIHRRDEILRETLGLTSDVVQSLEEQENYARQTNENLTEQNRILAQANEKMRSMNKDLTSVVNEMNDIEARQGCFCCQWKRRKKRKIPSPTSIDAKTIVGSKDEEKMKPTIPELIDNNDQEKRIVQELNQMKGQFLLFQGQIQTINRSFDEGEEILHQLGNESNQYMDAISTALTRAEEVLGKKFVN